MRNFGQSIFARIASLVIVACLMAASLGPMANARFISPDDWDPTIPGVGTNRYAYAHNDPINRADNNGHQEFLNDINVRLGYPNFEQRQSYLNKLISAYEDLAERNEADGDFITAEENREHVNHIRSLLGLTNTQLDNQAATGIGDFVLGALVGSRVTGTKLPEPALSSAADETLAGGESFSSFKALKKALGPAGLGKEWHHIVEQCQGACTRANFSQNMINNTKNVVSVTKAVNQRLSKYYSSKRPFTGGKTVRDWLNDKPFKEQFDFGVDRLHDAEAGKL